MDCITIAVTNNKGGVGKTTLSLNLATALACLGVPVGVIDMDPQGHISVSLDVVDEAGRPRDSIFNLLVNEMPIDKLIYESPADEYEAAVKTPGGKVWVLPGGSKTQLAAMNIQLQGGQVDTFSKAIQPMRERCQVIFIDSAPSNSLFTAGIYHASDWVLIPTQLNRLSLNGVRQTYEQIHGMTTTHDAKLLGIVPNMVQINTLEDQQRLGELVELYEGAVWHDVCITRSSVWNSASEEARSIFSYQSPTNRTGKQQAEEQMWRLSNRLCEKIGLEFPASD